MAGIKNPDEQMNGRMDEQRQTNINFFKFGGIKMHINFIVHSSSKAYSYQTIEFLIVSLISKTIRLTSGLEFDDAKR